MIPVAAVLAMSVVLGEQARSLSDGKALYQAAEFARAAARFEPLCRRGHAEACYWAGISYERLGDTRTPFGCPTYRKAHARLAEAASLAPAQYRGYYFEFLLDTAECSGSALREAGRLIAELSPSDPEAEPMRTRLEDTARRNGAPDTRLATLLLCVPRTAARTAALPGSLIGGRAGESREGKRDGRGRTSRRAPAVASSRPPAPQ